MNLSDILLKRHSVRKYQDTPVPDESISTILQLCQTGPSAGGIRGYEIIVTTEKVVSIQAPVYFVVCTKPETYANRYGKRGMNLYSIQDATIVAAYIQLIALDLGLATVWIGAFKESKIKRLLNLDDNSRPIAILPLGYEVV